MPHPLIRAEHVHSGLTGFVNLKPGSFNMLAAKQNKLAAECYAVLLTAIIDEFKIDKADAKKKNKLKLAKLYPFADDPEEGENERGIIGLMDLARQTIGQ